MWYSWMPFYQRMNLTYKFHAIRTNTTRSIISTLVSQQRIVSFTLPLLFLLIKLFSTISILPQFLPALHILSLFCFFPVWCILHCSWYQGCIVLLYEWNNQIFDIKGTRLQTFIREIVASLFPHKWISLESCLVAENFNILGITHIFFLAERIRWED